MTIVAGDHVKLTERFAATLMRRPQNKLDWAARRGVVRLSNKLHVWVIWDGRRYQEQLPHRVLEITDAPLVETPKKRKRRMT